MEIKNIRTTLRIPDELYNKIELFKRESNLKTINSSSIKLIELGLLKYQEDNFIEDLLLQIVKQNKYIIKLLEENSYGK